MAYNYNSGWPHQYGQPPPGGGGGGGENVYSPLPHQPNFSPQFVQQEGNQFLPPQVGQYATNNSSPPPKGPGLSLVWPLEMFMPVLYPPEESIVYLMVPPQMTIPSPRLIWPVDLLHQQKYPAATPKIDKAALVILLKRLKDLKAAAEAKKKQAGTTATSTTDGGTTEVNSNPDPTPPTPTPRLRTGTPDSAAPKPPIPPRPPPSPPETPPPTQTNQAPEPVSTTASPHAGASFIDELKTFNRKNLKKTGNNPKQDIKKTDPLIDTLNKRLNAMSPPEEEAKEDEMKPEEWEDESLTEKVIQAEENEDKDNEATQNDGAE